MDERQAAREQRRAYLATDRSTARLRGMKGPLVCKSCAIQYAK